MNIVEEGIDVAVRIGHLSDCLVTHGDAGALAVLAPALFLGANGLVLGLAVMTVVLLVRAECSMHRLQPTKRGHEGTWSRPSARLRVPLAAVRC